MKDYSLISLLKKSKQLKPAAVAEAIFLLGVFMLPFQIFTILWQPEIHLGGQVNQFQNAYLYASDILFLLSALVFFPSSKKITFGEKPTGLAFVGLAVLILATGSAFPIHWLCFKIATLATFYLLIVNEVATSKKTTYTLLLSGGLQSLIAIAQFINQGSIGLGMIGESNLSSSGIAKINIGDNQVVRGYGTMSHPNLLGGFLALAILLGSKFKKTMSLIILCVIGIVMTFSRSAMLGLAVAALSFTIFNRQKALTKNTLIVISIAAITVLSTGLAFKSHLFSTSEVEERLNQIAPSVEMIEENILGVGFANFTSEVQEHTTEKLSPWEIQPVHNIYLLSAAELSLLGAALILFLIILSLQKSPYKYAILAFATIGLFDHYLYTLYAGQIMAVMLFSMQQEN